ncbi:hypothetical protein DM860_002100 [Cuscuta australis]|uniref:Protein kinase domain-containing protein n=1 Tax=Cuscuta australis TaxID=267555 RepID=A0A328DZN1_9ASTE|nr:hypothetical protein DM860_002100 [Cuscuta australis]
MKLLRFLVFAGCFVFAVGQLPSQDILALLEFKKGIKHDPTGYVLQSWNEESIDFNGCPSSWNGIMCNGGNVAAVVLENLGLSATVDFEVFSNLTMLVKLSLANNLISGNFPEKIAGFRSLEYLDISDNLFSSSLPKDIGKFGTLKNLSVSGNNFSGSIPDEITGLTSIQSLDLSRNSFSGPVPSSLTQLSGLVYLNLSMNVLTKSIPRGFEDMEKLEVLDLHGNRLEGHLDPEFLMLTTATHVDLSGNLLVNSGSSQKRPLLPRISETVKYLNLSHNQLNGSLLSGGGEAQVFGNLKVLDLSYNQLSGELPGFDFVYDLQVLKLSNNRFSGFIPNDLLKGDSLVLTDLDLSGNNLTGRIGMIRSTTLTSLNLSSNALSGELPLVTGSCAVLDLSKNQFEGTLSRLKKWGNVEYLDLSQNRLYGAIPEDTAQFIRLHHLNLSRNALNSSLPNVITQFPKLTQLDLSFNQLTGPLLTALLILPNLEELHLQHNSFSGAIGFSPPPSGGSNLHVLDLSHNRFSGLFPVGLGSFLTRLQVVDVSENDLSGSLPSSIGDIVGLSSLDVSHNRFTGPLPTNLPTDTLQRFNASFNGFSGTVPENLRKFPLSSFYPGNSDLDFPNGRPGSAQSPYGSHKKKPIKTLIKVVIIVACVVTLLVSVSICFLLCYIHKTRRNKDVHLQAIPNPSDFSRREGAAGNVVVSADDIVTSRKGMPSHIISPDEKMMGLSPSKTSHFSWSPDSRDSYAAENFARLDVSSPDRLAGELYFLDDVITFTPEELSRAPAEVLGRSSHGTSYKATLDNGLLLTVKWLREGVAKQRKEFAKEAKKFANIRHPNVVGLRGYYWGPTQHEKLILSDYISPGSLASFLRDRHGRKGASLTWPQRLKIAVDVARGLNYLHFDREVPHGNLKATNILLDGVDLNARVADYCLHRLMTQSGTADQILDAGALGYRAPELAASKKPLPSFKSDVYAFGVVLLELLTGKRAGDGVFGSGEGDSGRGVDLIDWVRLKVAEGRGADCFDPGVLAEMGNPAVEKQMKEVLGIALRCIRSVSERPGIKTIYEDLSSI